MKKTTYILIVLILLGTIFHLHTSKNDISNRSKENLIALNDSIKYHKNKLNQEVASKLSLQLTLAELKDYSKENTELKEAIKKFKKPITIIQTKQVVKIDTIIKFKDSIKYVFSKDIPVNNKYYQFDVNINQNSLKIDNFTILNNQSIVVGWKKQGLFKNPIATAEITNTNPYFKQTEIKPIIIVYNKSWYEKPYITIPLGLLVGLIID